MRRGRRHTVLSTDMARRAVWLVRFLGGEFTRCYRCEVLLEPKPPSGSCGWGCTQYEPIWIGKMIGVSMTARLYKLP